MRVSGWVGIRIGARASIDQARTFPILAFRSSVVSTEASALQNGHVKVVSNLGFAFFVGAFFAAFRFPIVARVVFASLSLSPRASLLLMYRVAVRVPGVAGVNS